MAKRKEEEGVGKVWGLVLPRVGIGDIVMEGGRRGEVLSGALAGQTIAIQMRTV